MLILSHSIAKREEYEENEGIFSFHYGNMDNSLMTACAPMIDESQ